MLEIMEPIYNDILRFASQEKPNEACGILGGIDNRAWAFYPMANIAKSSTFYTMDFKEQSAVIKDLRVRDMNMIAIFHSHPHSPAYPSTKDTEMAFYPVIYLILSLQNEPDLRGFRINRKSNIIQKIKIKLIPGGE